MCHVMLRCLESECQWCRVNAPPTVAAFFVASSARPNTATGGPVAVVATFVATLAALDVVDAAVAASSRVLVALAA